MVRRRVKTLCGCLHNRQASPKGNSNPMMIVAAAPMMAQMRKFLAPALESCR